jgi:hypothetical protein
MVGKKKQSIPYEEMIESIIDKIISIEPKILIYRQKILTEMIREKYLDPNIPRKKIKRIYMPIKIDDVTYFKDDDEHIWDENKIIVGVATINNNHEYEYFLFSDINKQNELIDTQNKLLDNIPVLKNIIR